MLLEDPEHDLKAQRQGAVAACVRRARSMRYSHVIFKLIAVALTVAFSYIAINGVNPELAWQALRKSDYWWLMPAVVAFGLGTVARGLRWRSLFAHDRRPSRLVTMNAMMIGYLYNNILPARAGEAARIFVLKQRSTSPPVEITGTVVLERLYDIVVVLIMFFVAAPWLPRVSWFGTAIIAAAAFAISITTIAAVLAAYGDRPLRLLLRPLQRLPFVHEALIERVVSELAHGLSGLRRRRIVYEAFLWTACAWLCSILCAYFVTVAFHLQLSFAASLLVMVAIGLGMVLPSPPAAVGVFEGATLIALRTFNVPRSQALPYAVVLHLVNFLPYIIIGGLLLRYNARRPCKLEAGI